MDRSEQLTTERLVLKELADRDMEDMIRMVTDERIKACYMLPDLPDQAQKESFYKKLQALSRSDEHFVYGIFRDGKLIGFLNDCETDGQNIELGYFISPDCWNRGYAAEALRAAISELFRIGFSRVITGYFEENQASRRVMEKSGMHRTSQETVISYRGADHRCLYFEIEKDKKSCP